MRDNNDILSVVIVLLLALGAGILVSNYIQANRGANSINFSQIGQGGGPINLNPTNSNNRMEINLTPDPNSSYKQSGKAVLEEVDGSTKVTLTVNNPNNQPQPAHIHNGLCPNVGSVVYPLNSLVKGKSETTINTTIADLKKKEPLAVNVHKSSSELQVYTTCGDLTK